MPRIPHGRPVRIGSFQRAREALAAGSNDVQLGFAAGLTPDFDRFGYMFPNLQNNVANLVEQLPDTPTKLAELGRTMLDPGGGPDPGDSTIPAAYTYLGQFIDHDITLEGFSATVPNLLSPTLVPLTLAQVDAGLRNLRTASLDLDSVYGITAPPDPVTPSKMLVGTVTILNGNSKPFLHPPGKDNFNDLPRQARNPDPSMDRAARIGDPRNDENLIINQLHVAFLRAHNQLIDDGHTFRQARRILRQHYQHIVVHDFLRRVADIAIVDDILTNGPRVFDPDPDDPFMPLEFAAAGFRFGHSMVRREYDFNLNFKTSPDTFPASLELLFNFTALTGQLGDNDTLPDNWIIEWENLLDVGGPFDKTRRLDTKLVEPLFTLPDTTGAPEPGDAGRLAVRNLLRGYLLRLPTGQAVAGAVGVTPLTAAEITAATADTDQVSKLAAAGYDTRTPLWFYILAEAAHGGGNHLGPVGSIIVADVLIGLVKRSQDSIFDVPGGFQPSLPSGTDGQFTLVDLLTYAGVVPGNIPPDPQPRTYTVVAGDTLTSIAADQLGDGNRWPQIFALNRPAISDPNRIFAGQDLLLPDPADTGPIPRVYQVKAGDTLMKIAAQHLGDARRWTEILALNTVIISDPNRILIGQFLLLPAA